MENIENLESIKSITEINFKMCLIISTQGFLDGELLQYLANLFQFVC